MRRPLLPVLCALTAVLALALTYGVAHRKGRAQTCFEVALNLPDVTGRSLASEVLGRSGYSFDYSFWGTDCTISIGFDAEGDRLGGRWRFFPSRGLLFADDVGAEVLFPASGRWQPGDELKALGGEPPNHSLQRTRP
jgi:hypothetical protein